MLSFRRLVSSVAAYCACSIGAIAAPMTLNFNDDHTSKATDAGVPLTDQYTDFGLTFGVLRKMNEKSQPPFYPDPSDDQRTVIAAYNAKHLPNGIPPPPETDADKAEAQGFIGGSNFQIDISGGIFDMLALRLVGPSPAGFTVRIVGSNLDKTGAPLITSMLLGAGSNTNLWSGNVLSPSVDLRSPTVLVGRADGLGSIVAIQVFGAAYLDEMSFDCTRGCDNIPIPRAPEPGSNGLAALALLGVALVRKSRSA